MLIERDNLFVRAATLALALLLSVAPATADTGPCMPGANNVLVCGSGTDALLVLPDTTSPSGKLAVAGAAPAERPARSPMSRTSSITSCALPTA